MEIGIEYAVKISKVAPNKRTRSRQMHKIKKNAQDQDKRTRSRQTHKIPVRVWNDKRGARKDRKEILQCGGST